MGESTIGFAAACFCSMGNGWRNCIAKNGKNIINISGVLEGFEKCVDQCYKSSRIYWLCAVGYIGGTIETSSHVLGNMFELITGLGY